MGCFSLVRVGCFLLVKQCAASRDSCAGRALLPPSAHAEMGFASREDVLSWLLRWSSNVCVCVCMCGEKLCELSGHGVKCVRRTPRERAAAPGTVRASQQGF